MHAQYEAAGGGREEQREEGWAVVKGDSSAFVLHISAQDLR